LRAHLGNANCALTIPRLLLALQPVDPRSQGGAAVLEPLGLGARRSTRAERLALPIGPSWTVRSSGPTTGITRFCSIKASRSSQNSSGLQRTGGQLS
jgi:hypothetical protein